MSGYRNRPTNVWSVCFNHQLASIPEVGFKVSKLPELVLYMGTLVMVSFVRVVDLVPNLADVVVGNFHAQLLFNSYDNTAIARELVKGMVDTCHCA